MGEKIIDCQTEKYWTQHASLWNTAGDHSPLRKGSINDDSLFPSVLKAGNQINCRQRKFKFETSIYNGRMRNFFKGLCEVNRQQADTTRRLIQKFQYPVIGQNQSGHCAGSWTRYIRKLASINFVGNVRKNSFSQNEFLHNFWQRAEKRYRAEICKRLGIGYLRNRPDICLLETCRERTLTEAAVEQKAYSIAQAVGKGPEYPEWQAVRTWAHSAKTLKFLLYLVGTDRYVNRLSNVPEDRCQRLRLEVWREMATEIVHWKMSGSDRWPQTTDTSKRPP